MTTPRRLQHPEAKRRGYMGCWWISRYIATPRVLGFTRSELEKQPNSLASVLAFTYSAPAPPIPEPLLERAASWRHAGAAMYGGDQ